MANVVEKERGVVPGVNPLENSIGKGGGDHRKQCVLILRAKHPRRALGRVEVGRGWSSEIRFHFEKTTSAVVGGVVRRGKKGCSVDVG